MIEGKIPVIGDLRKGRIEAGAKRLYELRKRIGVILILSAAEGVFRHNDPAAKLSGAVITSGELGALR